MTGYPYGLNALLCNGIQAPMIIITVRYRCIWRFSHCTWRSAECEWWSQSNWRLPKSHQFARNVRMAYAAGSLNAPRWGD